MNLFMKAHEHTAISVALHSTEVWELFADNVYSILKCTQLENFFHCVNNLHQNIKCTMEEESNGELAFLDTLLKGKYGKISVLVGIYETYTYWPIPTKQLSPANTLHWTCLIEHVPLSQIKAT